MSKKISMGYNFSTFLGISGASLNEIDCFVDVAIFTNALPTHANLESFIDGPFVLFFNFLAVKALSSAIILLITAIFSLP